MRTLTRAEEDKLRQQMSDMRDRQLERQSLINQGQRQSVAVVRMLLKEFSTLPAFLYHMLRFTIAAWWDKHRSFTIEDINPAMSDNAKSVAARYILDTYVSAKDRRVIDGTSTPEYSMQACWLCAEKEVAQRAGCGLKDWRTVKAWIAGRGCPLCHGSWLLFSENAKETAPHAE